MIKDWTGNSRTTFATLGASSHANHDREVHDFYATHGSAALDLMRIRPDITDIWECAAGMGHLAKVFDEHGKLSRATELVDRGYGEVGVDFLQQTETHDGWIVTNPPFSFAKEFAIKANKLATKGVALFLRIQFLESFKRKELFDKYPPKEMWVYRKRCPQCALGGDFSKSTGNASTYCWFIWESGYKGEPTIKWID